MQGLNMAFELDLDIIASSSYAFNVERMMYVTDQVDYKGECLVMLVPSYITIL
jgi:hypothetical protein